MRPIYLDYNATTPVDPEVIRAMLPYLGDTANIYAGEFGNPSSAHAYGKRTHDAVHRARGQVAAMLDARPEEIIFTGGGTEASNHAIKGVVLAGMRGLFARWRSAPHVITCAIEHPATLQPCEFLRRLGCRITVLGVDRFGMVDPDAVRNAIGRNTVLVTLMHANNEVGTVQPIREIAHIARERGVVMHTDAAQSVGKIAVDVNELEVDLISIAGHKLYAPKGIGVLCARQPVKLEPLIHGAGHESGRRAGTENVPYIVGLGKACEIIRESFNTPSTSQGKDVPGKLRALRDRLWHRLQSELGEKVLLNGHPEMRLPNTLNANFVGHVGAEFLQKVPEIAASTGSACHEGLVTQSPVLCAMGVPPQIGQGAVRLSVGRFTTVQEVDAAADALIRVASGPRGGLAVG